MSSIEKLGKYKDLGPELQRLMNVLIKYIPVVICALGIVPKYLDTVRKSNKIVNIRMYLTRYIMEDI